MLNENDTPKFSSLICLGEFFENISSGKWFLTLLRSTTSISLKNIFRFWEYFAFDTATCSVSTIVRLIKQGGCSGYLDKYETDMCIPLGGYVCRICKVRGVGLCEPPGERK